MRCAILLCAGAFLVGFCDTGAEHQRPEIHALTPPANLTPEQELPMTIQTLDQRIEITPGVAGGKPRLAGHRITVQNIALWHEWMGRSVDEIATEYDLTLADVHAALAYYYAHQGEIDQSIRDSASFVDAQRARTPSKLVMATA